MTYPSYPRPTPQALFNNLASQLGAVTGADGRQRRSTESAFARMWAIASNDLGNYQDWISRQIFVGTSDDSTLVTIQAPLWGLSPKPPSPATGPVLLTGTPGATVPAGTTLQRTDGITFTLAADVTLSVAGTGTGTVTTTTAGAVGNTSPGIILSPLSPVPNISSTITVGNDGSGNGLSGGADPETAAALRGRVLARIQQPPQGGAVADYYDWTVAVPGVTRAWVLPAWLGPGSVGVTFVCDANQGAITPSATQISAVQAAIAAVRPVCAQVTVFAPTLQAVPITLGVDPNTVAVQQAVQAEIVDFFYRESVPGGTIYLSRLMAAISCAAGVYRQRLVTPAADLVMPAGTLAVPGPITWAAYP